MADTAPASDLLGLGPEWSETLPRRDSDTTPAAAEGSVGNTPSGPVDEEHSSYEEEAPPYDGPPSYDGADYYDDDDDSGYLLGDPGAVTASGSTNATRAPVTDRCDVGEGRIDSVFNGVVATLHGRPSTEVSSAVGRLRAAQAVWELMDPDQHKLWDGICEVLTFEVASMDGVGVIDFKYLPAKDSRRPQVAVRLEELRARSEAGDVPPNPMSSLDALVEDIAGQKFRMNAEKLTQLIAEGATAAEKMEVYRKLSPPTFQRAEANKTWVKTASEWLDQARSDTGGSSDITISFGFPTLEIALSGNSENIGVVKPGEFWVIGAGTGHGKSAFGRRAAAAAAYDLRHAWGRRNSVVLYAFTEEEAPDVAKAMMLDRGQPFHYLANGVVLGKVGQSRVRLVEMFYDSVAAAARRAMSLGIPIKEAGLPDIMFVDYIQGIHEQGENADTDGVANTADVLMRGIAAFDPDMIAQITGIDFRSYTGMDWPSGIDNHRVAVVVFSQLRKEGNDHTVFYRKGKSSLSDFVVMDENGMPCWEPMEDDYAIPNRSDLRGSGVLLNHATGLIFLHRSKPQSPVIKDPVTGKVIGVADTRARFIAPKARKAVAAPYIPARFDSNPEGFRGQFYDDMAEAYALGQGRMMFSDCWQRSGDPLVPIRPKRSPFAGIRY